MENILKECRETRQHIIATCVDNTGGLTLHGSDCLTTVRAIENIMTISHDTTRISRLFSWLTGKQLVSDKGVPLPEKERKDALWHCRFGNASEMAKLIDMACSHVEEWLGYRETIFV